MKGTSREETAGREPQPGPMEERGEASAESMWELLNEQYMYCQPRRGDIRQATVLDVRPDEVIVSIGAKANGVVTLRDLEQLDEETRSLIKPGAELAVCVLHTDYNGEILVSIKMAQSARDWQRAQEYLEQGTIVEGEVIGFNKGGALVRFGHIQGFLPNSQIVSVGRRTPDSEPASHLKELVGQRLPLKVIEVDRNRRRLILSERQARREWQSAQRRQLIAALQEGDVRHGVVSSLCDFGAFVDLGGVDGLVHISEISWERVQDPGQVLHMGQEVDVCVLSVDRGKERVSLSMKRLQPDPWSAAIQKYHEGQLVEGVITNVLHFGAFAQLEPGIEGLIHISELGAEPTGELEGVVKVGDRLQLRVLQVDVARHRISLSARQAAEQDKEQ